jgi:hypothetical protein
MAEKNALPAMANKVTIHLREMSLSHAKPVTIILQPASPQTPAQFKADSVTDNGRGSDHADQDFEIEDSSPRKKSARDDQRFTRHEEAEQRLTFQHHHEINDQITPQSELTREIGDVIYHDRLAMSGGSVLIAVILSVAKDLTISVANANMVCEVPRPESFRGSG